MSCWCVWFFLRIYWIYSVALSRIWARDACCNRRESKGGQNKDLVRVNQDSSLHSDTGREVEAERRSGTRLRNRNGQWELSLSRPGCQVQDNRLPRQHPWV